MKIFCDAFRYSTPFDGGGLGLLPAEILAVVDAAGLSLERSEEWQAMYRAGPDRGVLLAIRKRGYISVSVSGQVLAHLRQTGLFEPLLAAISLQPHRVTNLHATGDVAIDAAPVVAAALALGDAGKVSLSRKRVAPQDVQRQLAPDDRSVLSGTAYFGGPLANVRGVIYDKRKERMDKAGVDSGPLLRYEMRFGRHTGATLRDVWDPTELFYSAAAPDLLPLPHGVAPWRSHAEGFTLPTMHARTPVQLMRQLIETSPDIGRILRYAEACGPLGIEFLMRYLEERMASERKASVAAQQPPSPSSGVHPH